MNSDLGPGAGFVTHLLREPFVVSCLSDESHPLREWFVRHTDTSPAPDPCQRFQEVVTWLRGSESLLPRSFTLGETADAIILQVSVVTRAVQASEPGSSEVSI